MAIRDLRDRLGIGQADLARRLSSLTGRPLRGDRVYRWERKGVRPEPVYQDALDVVALDAPRRRFRDGIDPLLFGWE